MKALILALAITYPNIGVWTSNETFVPLVIERNEEAGTRTMNASICRTREFVGEPFRGVTPKRTEYLYCIDGKPVAWRWLRCELTDEWATCNRIAPDWTGPTGQSD